MIPPVCLIIFRRPAHTRSVIDALRKVRPTLIFVFADGPRSEWVDDVTACAAARAEVDRIDWPCELRRNYSEVNLGCGRGPATAISWAFNNVEECVILEDDCLPHPSFFPFCGELLEKYRDDTRIMHINGCTYRKKAPGNRESYYFCQDIGCWGWATWRRAWKHFDPAVTVWKDLRDTDFLFEIIDRRFFVEHYQPALDHALLHHGDVNYWDYQWAFACWVNHGLGIYPHRNLVCNLGCGPDATHTTNPANPMANLAIRPLRFPLVHPVTMFPHREIDRLGWNTQVPGITRVTRLQRLRHAVARISPPFLRRLVRRYGKQLKSRR